MKRIDPDTKELFLPHRYRDGSYRVADPRFGRTKHHAKNQIAVATESELLDLLSRGFHLRMRGTVSGQINLIKSSEIELT